MKLPPDLERRVLDLAGEVMPARGVRGAPESELLARVIAAAQARGWHVFHQRPAWARDGRMVSAVQGNGKGFPDLVCVRPPRLVVAELKAGKGRTTPEQDDWLARFRGVPGVEVYVWREADWADIERALGDRP